MKDDCLHADASLRPGADMTPRRLTHVQARMEQHLYWSRKSVAERLAACTELTRRLCRMRGVNLDERKADFAPRRIRRRRS